MCLYVCTARLNVYVADELAERARAADSNPSALTQPAITHEPQRRATDASLTSCCQAHGPVGPTCR
ncbi:hypothetical protein FHX44_115199 [Pseudonocardia hierapolitana]|uniref:Uncharacterized protein n=1 Tax=Pseudonocardia hierapolitana TaxID=1128676 RepID=A0A561SWM9_9PSEU|nr:hypothetical protein FHX44_115199 [Pseudonocardia hierapolitana]